MLSKPRLMVKRSLNNGSKSEYKTILQKSYDNWAEASLLMMMGTSGGVGVKVGFAFAVKK